MKNLLLSISVLLLSVSASAQNYGKKWSEEDAPKYAFVSIGFDAKHAVSGSKQTDDKPSIDAIIQIGANYHGVEVALEYEDHSSLKPKFQRYAVLTGYSFDIVRGVAIYNGISYGSIIRANNANFLSLGYNGEIRYDLGQKFMLAAKINVQQRRDIEHYCPDCKSREWVSSGFVSVYFKLN